MQVEDVKKQKDFLRRYADVNRKMEEAEAAQHAQGNGLQYIDLTSFPIDLNAMSLLARKQAEDGELAVFYRDGYDIRVATPNPDNALQKKYLQDLNVKKFKVQIYFISRASFKQLLGLYDKVVQSVAGDDEIIRLDSSAAYGEQLKKLEKIDKPISSTDLIAIIVGAANERKTSDIHIEPEQDFIKLRYRLDGVLADVCHIDKGYQKPLLSRIKIISKLKLNVDNVPQDGRFSYELNGAPADVRVSLLPSAYGEGVVMRILGTQAVDLKLKDLGLQGIAHDRIERQLQKPNGMILTTGPTGSGKTTSLYAFLNELNDPGVKIITLEDPVEYKLEGISQTPIGGGMTFAAGLRAILRQDPDVIMVGEIRDQETAETALQAALTGHVVLSTLHTNDAAGAIPRLINMGVKPFVIAPGLNAVIAQRLVRRLCQDCKQEVKLDPFLMEAVQKNLQAIPKASKVELPKELKFYHSGGCDKCNHIGYRGRIGIYEVIEKDDDLDKLIMAGASTAEIRQLAIKNGMITMSQDGLLKALQGITDVEEVFRVTEQ